MTTKEICADLDKIIDSVPDTDIQRIAREALTRLRHQEEELHTMREVSIAHDCFFQQPSGAAPLHEALVYCKSYYFRTGCSKPHQP
jgi:hypothetical protein